jgi:hypothetical protein
MCLIFGLCPKNQTLSLVSMRAKRATARNLCFMSNDGVNFFGLLTYDFLSKMDFREKNLQQVLNLLQVVS